MRGLSIFRMGMVLFYFNLSHIKELLKRNRHILIVTQQTNRILELLREQDIPANIVSGLEQMLSPGSISLYQGSFTEGWSLGNVLTLFTDNELFGFVKKRRLAKKRNVHHHYYVYDLTEGDYVVHIEHGIGKFLGLNQVSAGEGEQEYMVLEYAAGDKLYVPTTQMDRVSRYSGGGGRLPNLTRLGTQEWEHTKQRIKRSVADMAEDLIQLYAARETVNGFSFSKDTPWQSEVESSFPYVETPDQIERLIEIGCEWGQGNLFAEPVDASAAAELLEVDLMW